MSLITSSQFSSSSIPLIVQKIDGFIVDNKSRELIDRLRQQQSGVSVLSIVGKSKTGKSYLLNHLIGLMKGQVMENRQYFQVFDGIGKGTKGIRMFVIKICQRVVVVLDMQGLASLTSSTINQGSLFAMILLMSSTIIFNNLGPLDLQALQGLSILAEIGKNIENGLKNDDKKRMQSPSLVVALRDFSLSLENVNGQSITSKQYLEIALKQQRNGNGVLMGKNQMKKVLKDVFVNRDCFTLSLPSQEMPIKFGGGVREEFEYEVQKMAETIKKQLREKPKSLNGKELNIGEWMGFVQSLVGLVNKQEKGGNLKLQNLLFQAYRRQQGTVRDRFALLCDTLLKKSQLKSSQMTNLLDLFQQIDDNQLSQSSSHLLRQLQKLQSQLQTLYQNSCTQIQQMILRQGPTSFTSIKTDYFNPSIANLKDFSQLYNIMIKTSEKISLMKKDIVEKMDQWNKMKDGKCKEKKEQMKFIRVMEQIGMCQKVKDVQKKYMEFVKELKEQGTVLDSKTLQAYLLKVQVVYLRRKIQCTDRQQSQYQSSRQANLASVTSILQQKSSNKILASNYSSTQKSKLYSFASKQIVPFNLPQSSSSSKSFLVPYLTLSQSQVKTQILRTLIKQDNRGNNYIQYVLQVVLLSRKWRFNRRWKDFNQLHNILSHLFGVETLPIFRAGDMVLSEREENRKEEVQVRRGKLEDYLRELLEIDKVRNSRIMQKFLKINKQYVPFL